MPPDNKSTTENVEPDRMYSVLVLKPFLVDGIRFSPLDSDVRLRGDLVSKFKNSIAKYTLLDE